MTWEPSFRKYVKDYDPEEEEWSPSYLKREGVYKQDLADNYYECTCGRDFGTNEEEALDHVKTILEGEK